MVSLIDKNLQHLNRTFGNLNLFFEIKGSRVIVKGPSYDHREKLKAIGFKFNKDEKIWEIPSFALEETDMSSQYVGPYQKIEDTKKKILDYIAEIKDPYFHTLLDKLLIRGEYKSVFFVAPGAKTFHHAYDGGLAEHSLQMLEGALQLYQLYPYIAMDRELLITSAILHDIGKVKCYVTTSEGIQTTKYLEMFDHIILGVSIIGRASEELLHNESDRKHFESLTHIITSHHNIKEWGSPIEPKTPEAWIIHTMDMISAKIGGEAKLKKE